MRLTNSVISTTECLHPIRIISQVPLDCEKTFRGNKNGVHTVYKNIRRSPMYVPCGVCPACMRKQSRQWQSRINWHMDTLRRQLTESKFHCFFLTLTFDDFFLPEHHLGSNANEKKMYHLVQNFFKKLRKGFAGGRKGDFYPFPPMEFDYYCVGEFGEHKDRFHFHVILMVKNYDTIRTALNHLYYIVHPDRHYIGKKKYKRLQTIEEATFDHYLRHNGIWSFGLTQVGGCDTGGSAGYVTKYATKDQSDINLGTVPFHRQSQSLGISWLMDNWNGVSEQRVTAMQLDPKHSNFGFVAIPRSWYKKAVPEETRISWFNTHVDETTRRMDEKYLQENQYYKKMHIFAETF